MKDNRSLKSFWTSVGAVWRTYKYGVAHTTSWKGLPESEANTEGPELTEEDEDRKEDRKRRMSLAGKNTGVGCHFLLQCLKVKSESEVAQPCLTLSDPMDCSLLGSSIHGIFQARVLEWGAIALNFLTF